MFILSSIQIILFIYLLVRVFKRPSLVFKKLYFLVFMPMIFLFASLAMIFQAALIYMQNKDGMSSVRPNDSDPFGFLPEGGFTVLANTGFFIYSSCYVDQCLTIPILIQAFNKIRLRALMANQLNSQVTSLD